MSWLIGRSVNVEPEPLKKTLCYGAVLIKEGDQWSAFRPAWDFLPLLYTVTTGSMMPYLMIDTLEGARTYPLNCLEGMFP